MSTSTILGSLFVNYGSPLLEINPRNVVRSICTRNLLFPRFPRRKIPNAYCDKKEEKNRVAKFQRIALMNFCFFIILLCYACKRSFWFSEFYHAVFLSFFLCVWKKRVKRIRLRQWSGLKGFLLEQRDINLSWEDRWFFNCDKMEWKLKKRPNF